MTYPETVSYLYAQLPAFQKIGKEAMKPSLDNIKAICYHLGNPQDSFPSIHVAGTNGKGSSCHMLASVLQEAGYKVGLYTSPHLKDFRERFRINGKLVKEELVTAFVENHKNFIEELKPSFFEVTVALAFDIFAKEAVDFAIIETGLGGRLDSTNVIQPIVSLITNIGYDHMDVLGSTLPLIAAEKGGIIKKGVPVVISERNTETDEVFMDLARQNNSSITFAQDKYAILESKECSSSTTYVVNDLSDSLTQTYTYNLDLKGNYQEYNLLGVLAILGILENINAISINKLDISNGVANVILNTGLRGRWQTLGLSPRIITDTGHNSHAFNVLKDQISQYNDERCHFILGFASDKDMSRVLEFLPKASKYYFCTFNSPRSQTGETLKRNAINFNINEAEFFHDVNIALESVKKHAKKEDFIFIGGSTYLVAELENL